MAHHDALTDLPNRVLFREQSGAGARARAARRRRLRGAVPRPRPLQGRQRHARPPGRRRAAEGGARAPAARCVRETRHGRAARRRRIRHPADRRRAAGGRRQRWRAASSRRSARPTRSTATRSSSAPASASRSRRPTAPTPDAAAEERRPGALPRQGRRPRHLPLLRAGDGRATAGAPRARARPAPRAGARRVRAATTSRWSTSARDEITGFEALLRWHHPERGMVPPAEFIPLAEETGLIVADRRMGAAPGLPRGGALAGPTSRSRSTSRRCSSAAATWSQVGDQRAGAVGPAGRRGWSWRSPKSVLLQRQRGDARDPASAARRSASRIAMDDFGTGYSSLSYLRSFPFDKIKIDRSFVRDMSDRSRTALRSSTSIASLGASLGMATTAEGVETEEQLELLKRPAARRCRATTSPGRCRRAKLGGCWKTAPAPPPKAGRRDIVPPKTCV